MGKPLPIAWIKLGSLVPDPYYPHQDAQRPISPAPEQDYMVAPVKNYYEKVNDEAQTRLRLHLTKILGETIGWDNTETRTVTAVEGRLYALKEPNAWFKGLCQDPNAKEWLQAAMNAGDVYLIAGFQTFTNARYSEDINKGWGNKSEAGVPEQVTTAAVVGVPIDLGGLLDVEGEVTVGGRKRRIVRYTTPEEQVYKIHYKKVRFKSFWRKDVDTALLGQHVDVDLTSRGSGGVGSGQDEKVFTASLADDLDVVGEKVHDEESDDVYIFLDE